jgi:hypothetical protein
MLEAERQFRKIMGHQDLVTVAVAIDRDLVRSLQILTDSRHQSFPPA